MLHLCAHFGGGGASEPRIVGAPETQGRPRVEARGDAGRRGRGRARLADANARRTADSGGAADTNAGRTADPGGSADGRGTLVACRGAKGI